MKKKADELGGRFKPLCDDRFYNDGGVRRDESQRTKNAIQCAIICVEEIIKALPAISCKYTIDNEWGPVINELKSRLGIAPETTGNQTAC